eukprot:scaffold422261_cov83-Attheya_sp.AAC.1
MGPFRRTVGCGRQGMNGNLIIHQLERQGRAHASIWITREWSRGKKLHGPWQVCQQNGFSR